MNERRVPTLSPSRAAARGREAVPTLTAAAPDVSIEEVRACRGVTAGIRFVPFWRLVFLPLERGWGLPMLDPPGA